MLRENLDTVLKELLEFKPGEHIISSYPGSHLDLEDNLLENVQIITQKTPMLKRLFHDLLLEEFEKNKRKPISHMHEKHETTKRIRRYMDKKDPKSKLHVNWRPIFTGHLNRKKVNDGNGYKNIKTKDKRAEYKRGMRKNLGRKLQMYGLRNKRVPRQVEQPLNLGKCDKKNDNNIATNQDDDPAKGDAALKARFLFKSCMNYEILQKRGHEPLLDLLKLLGGWPILDPTWKNLKFDWLELMAKLRLYNNDILISEWVGPDIKNSDEFVIQFDQTSLGK